MKMKNSNGIKFKFRKIINKFLSTVFQFTGMMAILFPLMSLLVSIPLQFTPQNHETAVAMRTTSAIIVLIGSGGILGFLIGCAMGFVMHIFPALFVPKKEKSDDVDEITK